MPHRPKRSPAPREWRVPWARWGRIACRWLSLKRRRASWFDRATHGVGIGVWQWNVREQALIWDDTMWEVYGLDPADYPSPREAWWSTVFPEDATRVNQEEAELMERGGGEISTMFRIRHPRKGVRYISSRCTIEYDEAGHPIRVIGINDDITERVIEQREREQQRVLVEHTSRLAKVAGWHLNIITSEVTWTEGVYRIHDLPEGQAPSIEEAVSFYTPSSRAKLEQAMAECQQHARPFDLELEIITALRRRVWVRVMGEPLHEGDKCVALVGAIQDISEQRAIREQLREATAAAQSSNEAKTAFLANISHELRTPLTSIIGFAGLAREDGDQVSQHLDTIQRNGEHLLAVINDLLDLSKAESGKLSLEYVPTDMRSITRDLRDQYRLRADPERLSIEAHVAHDVPRHLLTDPTRVRQILHNLLNNAVKFTDAGCVVLSVTVVSESNPPTLTIAVTDTGKGIAPEDIERILKPFEQADVSTTRHHGGTGLGLAITTRLIEMLGGTFDIVSKPGEGSTFTVRLPFEVPISEHPVYPAAAHALTQAAQSEAAACCSASSPPLAGLRALVVDDSPEILRLLTVYLSRCGAIVHAATHGAEALDIIQAEEFGVVITDLHMPGMDGMTLIKALRSMGITARIAAMSAHISTDLEEQCREAGCCCLIPKPIDRDDLIARLQQHKPFERAMAS